MTAWGEGRTGQWQSLAGMPWKMQAKPVPACNRQARISSH